MYIIVGLGNPGKQYEHTRHNVGFLTIDDLADKHNIKVNKIKHKALIGEGFIGREKVLLVKPQTFMNLSGRSVREIIEYYKVDPDKLIVIYDDVDIEVGKVRIRKKGSAGTHNGMRSILYDIQTDLFPRVRIGIGKDERIELGSYVLSKFKKEEIDAIKKSIIDSAQAVEVFIQHGIDKAMNEYN